MALGVWRDLSLVFFWTLFFVQIFQNESLTSWPVDICPGNESEVEAATLRLNCSDVRESINVYHCLPLSNLSGLVEFCYDAISGLVEAGNCMVLYRDTLNNYPCRNFNSGCPTANYFPKKMYNYQACLKINTYNSCYIEDPNCPYIRFLETTSLSTVTAIEKKSQTVEITVNGNDNNMIKYFIPIMLGFLFPPITITIIVWNLRSYERKRKDVPEEKKLLHGVERFITTEEEGEEKPGCSRFSISSALERNNPESSIGYIRVQTGYTGAQIGTGFRVGEKYVMTSFNVVKKPYETFWCEIWTRMKLGGEDKMLEDGTWSLTDLLKSSSLTDEEQSICKTFGEMIITESCSITFGCDGNEKENTFKFKYDAPYISRKHDIAILELKKDSELPFPSKLNLAKVRLGQKRLNILGYLGREKQLSYSSCSVVTDQKELDIIKKDAIQIFGLLGQTQSKIEEEYKECEISADHILFYLSENETRGAAGSPLFQVNHNKKIEVIGMLLRGYPKMFYNEFYGKKKTKIHPDILLKFAVSIERLRSLLKSPELSELYNDFFESE